jgi:CRISPR-associated protein Cas2
MSDAKWWMVCYDVHDLKRLRKCAKHMEGYGERIQYSVFRCWMGKREVERLRWELTELLDSEDDVMLIPLCSSCVGGIVGIHGSDRPPDWTSEPDRHRIV